MRSPINLLIAAIEDERVIGRDTLSAIDGDAFLDDRDSDKPFEQQWLRVHGMIEQLWNAASVDDDRGGAVDKLREAAFFAVGGISEHQEMAAYVSDDFDLIGKALVLDVNDPWLNGLFLAYKSGGVGRPGIQQHPGQLKDLI